jgi:hypothetical protein
VVPEIDIERVRRWAATRVPVHLQDQIRIEVEVSDRAITILECHPPWSPQVGPEWSRLQVARLRYTKKRNEWSLYWSDRNSDFHVYDLVEPSTDIADLIAEIEADPTCIFWG